MPFVKGKSGNPGGRPKVSQEVQELARKHGPAAIKKLVEHLNGDDGRLSQQAAVALLDRGYGKPAQGVTVSGDEENPLYHEIVRHIVHSNDKDG